MAVGQTRDSGGFCVRWDKRFAAIIFAADRGNTRVASRYDTLSPAVLRVLHSVVEACKKSGVEASVCGEMAGQPLDALALIALGYRQLSMSASGVGPRARHDASRPIGRYRAICDASARQQ